VHRYVHRLGGWSAVGKIDSDKTSQGPNLQNFIKCTYVNVTKKSDIRKVYERIAKELRCFMDA